MLPVRMCSIVLSTLLIAGAATAAAPMAANDYRQLMETAVAVSSARSEVEQQRTTICVEQALGPPLGQSKQWPRIFKDAGQDAKFPHTGLAAADLALKTAITSDVATAQQAIMPPLPSRFILVTDAQRPVDCVIEHIPAVGQPKRGNDSAVVLSFTRPALVNGYAFIEQYEDCPGLCGTTHLRVFRKQHGKWAQVAETVLSVS